MVCKRLVTSMLIAALGVWATPARANTPQQQKTGDAVVKQVSKAFGLSAKTLKSRVKKDGVDETFSTGRSDIMKIVKDAVAGGFTPTIRSFKTEKGAGVVVDFTKKGVRSGKLVAAQRKNGGETKHTLLVSGFAEPVPVSQKANGSPHDIMSLTVHKDKKGLSSLKKTIHFGLRHDPAPSKGSSCADAIAKLSTGDMHASSLSGMMLQRAFKVGKGVNISVPAHKTKGATITSSQHRNLLLEIRSSSNHHGLGAGKRMSPMQVGHNVSPHAGHVKY